VRGKRKRGREGLREVEGERRRVRLKREEEGDLLRVMVRVT
jgi:hypothetical protein